MFEEEKYYMDIVQLVRATLIPEKHGIFLEDFIKTFRENTGQSLVIAASKLGFESVRDLIASMDDAVEVETRGSGQFWLRAVSDEKTRHISDMVAKQKTDKQHRERQHDRRFESMRSNSLGVGLPRPSHTSGGGKDKGESETTEYGVRSEQHEAEPRQVPVDVKYVLRSMLERYHVNEIGLDAFLQTFKDFSSKPLNPREYGFPTVPQLLKNVPDLLELIPIGNTFIVKPVKQEEVNVTIAHLREGNSTSSSSIESLMGSSCQESFMTPADPENPSPPKVNQSHLESFATPMASGTPIESESRSPAENNHGARHHIESFGTPVASCHSPHDAKRRLNSFGTPMKSGSQSPLEIRHDDVRHRSESYEAPMESVRQSSPEVKHQARRRMDTFRSPMTSGSRRLPEDNCGARRRSESSRTSTESKRHNLCDVNHDAENGLDSSETSTESESECQNPSELDAKRNPNVESNIAKAFWSCNLWPRRETVIEKMKPENEFEIPRLVKKNLRELVTSHSVSGIKVQEIGRLFEEKFGFELDVGRYGCENMTVFALQLPGIFKATHPTRMGGWNVFPASDDPVIPEKVVEDMRRVLQVCGDEISESRVKTAHKSLIGYRLDYKSLGFKAFDEFMKCLHDDLIDDVHSGGDTLVHPKSQALEPDRKQPKHESKEENVVLDGLDDFFTDEIELVKFKARPGRLIEVFVAEVYTPEHFFVQLHKTSGDLSAMMDDMQQFYDNRRKTRGFSIPEDQVKKGLYCVCKFETEGWHRGFVKSIKDNGFVDVMLFDYGTVYRVHRSELKYLHRQFATLPRQGILARLASIRPIGRKWSKEASMFFLSKTECTGDDGLFAFFRGQKIEKGETKISLQLISNETEDEICINTALVEEGHAVADPDAKHRDDQPAVKEKPAVKDQPVFKERRKMKPLRIPRFAMKEEGPGSPERQGSEKSRGVQVISQAYNYPVYNPYSSPQSDGQSYPPLMWKPADPKHDQGMVQIEHKGHDQDRMSAGQRVMKLAAEPGLPEQLRMQAQLRVKNQVVVPDSHRVYDQVRKPSDDPSFSVNAKMSRDSGRVAPSPTGTAQMPVDQEGNDHTRISDNLSVYEKVRRPTDHVRKAHGHNVIAKIPTDHKGNDQVEMPIHQRVFYPTVPRMSNQVLMSVEDRVHDQGKVPTDPTMTNQVRIPTDHRVSNQVQMPVSHKIHDQGNEPTDYRAVNDQVRLPSDHSVPDQARKPVGDRVHDHGKAPTGHRVSSQVQMPTGHRVHDQMRMPTVPKVPSDHRVSDQVRRQTDHVVNDQVKKTTDHKVPDKERTFTDHKVNDQARMATDLRMPRPPIRTDYWMREDPIGGDEFHIRSIEIDEALDVKAVILDKKTYMPSSEISKLVPRWRGKDYLKRALEFRSMALEYRCISVQDQPDLVEQLFLDEVITLECEEIRLYLLDDVPKIVDEFIKDPEMKKELRSKMIGYDSL